MSLTYRFTGPVGQEVSSVAGSVVVLLDRRVGEDLEYAASTLQPVTPTGPWVLGGRRMTDPASVFWAARAVLHHGWTVSGDSPSVPEVASEPGVVYSPIHS